MDESFDALLFDLLGVRPNRVSAISCPVCGATLQEISRTGRVGCQSCYQTFAPQLLPYIQRIHVRVEHTGRVPHGADAIIARRRQITALEQQLQDAVAHQEFEQAAHLRDELRQLRDTEERQKKKRGGE